MWLTETCYWMQHECNQYSPVSFLDGVGMKLKSAKSMRSTMATKLNEHDSTQP